MVMTPHQQIFLKESRSKYENCSVVDFAFSTPSVFCAEPAWSQRGVIISVVANVADVSEVDTKDQILTAEHMQKCRVIHDSCFTSI